ncbi:elongation factor Tu GTP binding domain-containing protein [Apiospora arundinis]
MTGPSAPDMATSLQAIAVDKENAKPYHFDVHRDTITYLYARDGLNLTLKETMQVMEKRYAFVATARIYKTHLAKWKLNKNAKKEWLKDTRPKQMQAGARPPLRHRDGKETLNKEWVHELLRHVSLERAARGRPPPLVASLQLPAILRVPEHHMHYIRQMLQLSWEVKVVPTGRVPSNKPINEWFGRMVLACRLLEYGRVCSAFRLLNACFDQFADVVLKGLHPGAWVHGYIAGFLLGLQSPELGRSYARYTQRLNAISNHPKPLLVEGCGSYDNAFCSPVAPRFADEKAKGQGASGFSDLSLLSGRPLCEFYGSEMLSRLGPLGGVVTDTFSTHAIPRFGDVRDLHVVVGAIRKLVLRPARPLAPHDALGRDVRDRDFWAWIGCRSERYDEAAGLLDGIPEEELVRAYADNPEGVISYYDTRALLAQSDERQSVVQVVETATRLIDLLKARYGLADHRTIDAQADLEACLRKRGEKDQAKEVRRDINKALDAVEEKLNAMHLSSSSKQA